MDSTRTSAVAAPFNTTSIPLDPQYHGWVLILICAICFPLLLFFVTLRLYVRIWKPRSFALDDAACLLATIGTISYAAVFLSSVNLAGRPIASLPIITFNTRFFQELVFVYEMLYGPTVFFAKLSLFLLYLRIFSPDRWTRFLIYFGIGVTFIYYTVTACIPVGLCFPRKGESWPLALLSARCHKAIIMSYVQGIFNIVSDLYVLILPIPVIWKLQLPLRKRIGVYAVFTTGLLACGASSLGFYFRIILSDDTDWTQHEVGLGGSVIFEMTMGIICGCMPYLAPILKRWYTKSSQLYTPKNLMSRSTFRFKRHLNKSKKSSNSDEIEVHPKQGHYLETRILGSVKGAGKFLDSQNPRQKEWLDRTTISQQSCRNQAIPENWKV